jgi:hypothetical protein
VTGSLILGASNPEIFSRTIRRLASLLMAPCAKHSGSNGSISGLQPVSIADDFATVVVAGTIVGCPCAHDCACFSRHSSLTVYLSFDLAAVDSVDSVRE